MVTMYTLPKFDAQPAAHLVQGLPRVESVGSAAPKAAAESAPAATPAPKAKAQAQAQAESKSAKAAAPAAGG